MSIISIMFLRFAILLVLPFFQRLFGLLAGEKYGLAKSV
jgi:hypothetical protein